jgi:hypothetical protein
MLKKAYPASTWNEISEFMGNKNPKQCRERYARLTTTPTKKNRWTKEEADMLLELHDNVFKENPEPWEEIASLMDGKTAEACRRKWFLLASEDDKLKYQKGPAHFGSRKRKRHQMA